MTDDIVTKLRNIASLRGDISGKIIPIACLEAADEIERLQIDLSESKYEYQKLWEKYNRRNRNG